ncbi:MAG TPA: hypothetical protein VGG11_12665 [Xanthobacteraceae bacterium]
MNAGMSERQKVTMAKLVGILEAEFATSLGRRVAEYMPRIRIRARAGEPNWHADIGGDTGLTILGAFLESLDRVRAVYDLDAEARDQLMVPSRTGPRSKSAD